MGKGFKAPAEFVGGQPTWPFMVLLLPQQSLWLLGDWPFIRGVRAASSEWFYCQSINACYHSRWYFDFKGLSFFGKGWGRQCPAVLLGACLAWPHWIWQSLIVPLIAIIDVFE